MIHEILDLTGDSPPNKKFKAGGRSSSCIWKLAPDAVQKRMLIYASIVVNI